MKRALKLIVGLLAGLIVTASKTPFYNKTLDNIADGYREPIEFVLFLIIGMSIIFNYIVTIHNPEKKYEDLLKANNIFLQSEAEIALEPFTSKGYVIKFNVMVVKRYWWFAFLYPDNNGKGKFIPFPRIFKCVWTSSKNHFISEKFRLGIKQGTSGDAREQERQSIFVNQDENDFETAKQELKLNKKQWEKTKHIKLLMSDVIKSTKGDGKIIGIMTLESENEQLATIMSTDPESIDDKALKEQFLVLKIELASLLSKMAVYYNNLHV